MSDRKRYKLRRTAARTTRNRREIAPDHEPSGFPPPNRQASIRLRLHELGASGADILLALAAAVVSGIAYFPIVRGLLSGPSDYTAHASFAQLLVDKGIIYAPACLFHLLVAGIVVSGATASFRAAALAVAVGSYALLGAMIYFAARQALGCGRSLASRLVPLAVAIALPFVQPVEPRISYTIGYLWAEPYYSPTYVLLKPLALAASAFAVCFLTPRGRDRRLSIVLCAAVVAAGTLAKPNFALCALPAVVVCSAWNYLRKRRFSMAGVAFGILLPALAVLLWQYQRTYASVAEHQYSDSIVFAPLAVMKYHATGLALKYLLSVLFPLSVLAVYGRRAWADTGLRFSSVAFAFGTAYTYTLAEKQGLGNGNFLWGTYITLFILFFFSIAFLLRQIRDGVRTPAAWLRATPCLLALAAHLESGISTHLLYLRMYLPKFPL